MKALSIQENIEFTRSIDPKEILNIGERIFIKQGLRKLIDDVYIHKLTIHKDYGLTNDIILDIYLFFDIRINAQYFKDHIIGKALDVKYFSEIKKAETDYAFQRFFCIIDKKYEDFFISIYKEIGYLKSSFEANIRYNRNKKKGILDEVNESLNFERGSDPKQILNIGEGALIKQGLRDLKNHVNIFSIYVNDHRFDHDPHVILEVQTSWKLPIKSFKEILKLIFQKDYFLEIEEVFTQYLQNKYACVIKEEYQELFLVAYDKIIKEKNNTNESLNFERSSDPRKTLDIGLVSIIDNIIKELRYGAYGLSIDHDEFENTIIDFEIDLSENYSTYYNTVILNKDFFEDIREYTSYADVKHIMMYIKPIYSKIFIERYNRIKNNTNESLNFSKDDPMDLLDIGLYKNSLFKDIESRPLKEMIEKTDGEFFDEWPYMEEFLKIASEMLYTTPDKVLVATNKGDFLNMYEVEEFYYNSGSIIDQKNVNDRYYIQEINTSELFVIDRDINDKCLFMLGRK